MGRNFHRRERMSAMSEINVTPLIDLAFALLIIFMITAPLLEQSIDINLPVERARPQPADGEPPVELSIDAQGNFYWREEPVGEDELLLRLERLAAGGAEPVIQIRADATLPYQRVVDLLDTVKDSGLRKISLETRGR